MKKGFTLIELLAVIVILAIIAVIAVPIVLNIIDDSKKNSTLRSADFYLDAVEFSVAQATLKNKNIQDGTYNILKSGNVCLSYDNEDKCIDELIVEVNGEVPEDGTITIENGKIIGTNIILNEKEIAKNNENELVYLKKLDEVCTPDSEQLYTTNPLSAGYKYNCKVDPNKDPYTFFVLTTPSETDKSINLIMDSNINKKGEAIKSEDITDKGFIQWLSVDDYVKSGGIEENFTNQGWINIGPVTAMNFIQEITKTWTNTNVIIVNTFDAYTSRYEYIDTYKMKTYNTYARLPYKSELAEATEANKYLYEYLQDSGSEWYGTGAKPANNISHIGGYWTLSASYYDFDPSGPLTAFNASYLGIFINFNYINWTEGVRPVITLNL